MRVPDISRLTLDRRVDREAWICDVAGSCSLFSGPCSECAASAPPDGCKGIDAHGRRVAVQYYLKRSRNSGILVIPFPREIEVLKVYNDTARVTKKKYIVDRRLLFLSISQNVDVRPRFKVFVSFRYISFGEYILRRAGSGQAHEGPKRRRSCAKLRSFIRVPTQGGGVLATCVLRV